MKYLHHIIDKVILAVIGRSFSILSNIDPRIEKELSYLPETFTAAVAVEKNGPYIVVRKNKNNVQYFGYHKQPKNLDLKLYFKDEKFAYQVLAAKVGIRQAFSEYRIVLKGDLEYAVSFIYILEIIEAYIMQDDFAEEVLNYNFERKISRTKLMIKVLFLKREKGEI